MKKAIKVIIVQQQRGEQSADANSRRISCIMLHEAFLRCCALLCCWIVVMKKKCHYFPICHGFCSLAFASSVRSESVLCVESWHDHCSWRHSSFIPIPTLRWMNTNNSEWQQYFNVNMTTIMLHSTARTATDVATFRKDVKSLSSEIIKLRNWANSWLLTLRRESFGSRKLNSRVLLLVILS